ncbi:MAG: tetratricopeptide repeat protein, partial [Limisphaerales bacterium]
MKKHQIFPVLVAACLGGLALAGCSQRAKTHYSLQRANAMFESGQFDRAESEYLNVLRADPRNAQAIGRLGLIYYNEGRFQKAAPYLYKGSEMSSSNLELRVKLGIICLAIGDRKEAHDQAAFVLKNNPANSEAPVLLAQSAAQGQFASLKQQFNGLIAQGDSAPLETALGILASRQDHVKDALEKFQRALNLKSQFAPAYD